MVNGGAGFVLTGRGTAYVPTMMTPKPPQGELQAATRDTMDKKALSESDICDKYIRPAMLAVGWHGLGQIYREFPLRAGRVVVRGNHARRDASTVLRADYALFYKPNLPLAVVEAKDAKHIVGAGMQQAIQYAELLGVPFVFSSNGDGFVFRDAKLVFEKSYDEIRELSAGGAQPNLNVGKVKSTLIPLPPPLAEQSRIVTRVAQLRRLCADLRQRLTTAQSTQSHLAQALVAQVA